MAYSFRIQNSPRYLTKIEIKTEKDEKLQPSN